MLRVWTNQQSAGHLDRHGSRGTAFVYEPKAAAERAVSITMPVRTASWNTQHGLAPIFDMNLPEGALRAYLVRSFAKATGTFDDFDVEMRKNFCECLRKFWSLISAVGEQRLQERVHSEQCRKQQDATVAILHVRGMNDGVQQQT